MLLCEKAGMVKYKRMEFGVFRVVTLSFISIRQSWWNYQFPALSCAHVLQTFIPTLHHLLDPKCEPYWIFVSIFAAANGENNASHYGDGKQL